jgi:hypothetical protein
MAKLSNKNRNALELSEGIQFICKTHNWQSAVYDTEDNAKPELIRHLKKFPQPHEIEMVHEQLTKRSYNLNLE